ncbi:MAG TPA: wax ester/triacylglycerol synthase family O-acyltransferase [Jatrophihabitans sp.]|nr:wax ester/triacylglycerol synthase family O-acyltransferase [Jatrophihabitans sp.]
MQRLTAIDASFLFSEDGRSHNDIGMVLQFDGPAMTRADVMSAIAGRLALVPRFRQRIRQVPMAAALPVWVDDTRFDIARHVFESAAPAGGDPLGAAVSRVMSDQLDHDLPLWQAHVITGLADDGWALVVRMHHAMVDGVSSTEIVRVLLSDSTEPAPTVPDDWRPAPEPTGPELVAAAMADAARDTAQAFGAMVGAQPPSLGTGPPPDLRPLMVPGLPIPDAALNGPIQAARCWGMTDVPLATLKRISKSIGGTVKDVLMTAAAHAFTELLRSRGEPVDERVLRAMVPVSLRAGGSGGPDNAVAGGNEVGAMLVQLPLGDSSPAARLQRIREQTAAFKALKDVMPANQIAPGPGLTSPLMVILGTRMAALAPAAANTVVTNVPGPQQPLYFDGRRLRRLGACIALWAPLRIAVSIMSYDGTAYVGVVTDRSSIPEVAPVLAAFTAGIEELAVQTRERKPN